MTNSFHEIVGAIHIHSIYSDGTGDIPEISRLGEEAGLDFLLISDHHTLKGRDEGLQGFYGRLLTLIGYETSDNLDHNHYLVFGCEKVNYDLYASDYTANIKKSGGIGFIAHPFEKRSPDGEYPPYPWDAWECKEYDGIEIWNQLSEWTDGLTKLNKIYRFIHPLRSLKAPPSELLTKWDELAQNRKIIGIAGVDAHSFKIKVFNLFKVKIFHYKVTFKSLRNHFLISDEFPRGDALRAEELIMESLRAGRIFFSNYRRGDAKEFRFTAKCDDRNYTIGDEVSGKNIEFKVKSPLDAEISLIHNGNIVKTEQGRYLEYASDSPGVYRAEAKRNGHAWVFTNHIYLK